MSRTASFRTQHKELVEIVQAISAKLNPAAAAAEADQIRHLLSSLSGKLNFHLAMEDKSLYPAMLASTDPAAKKAATEFMNEMGGLATAFKNYVAAWPTAAAIKEKPADFCAQTQGVFAALGKRVEREESVLYALADKV